MSVRGAYSEQVGDYLGLKRRAIASGASTALAAPGQEPLTYAALCAHITSVGHIFHQAGMHAGEVVVLALPSGPAFITAALAITSEWACAPLDLDLAPEECRRFLNRLNASTLCFEDGIASPALQIARELGMRIIRVRARHDLAAGLFTIGQIENPSKPSAFRRSSAALLFQTSATTGIPKLVAQGRTNLRAAAHQDARALQLTAADRFLSLMPLHYGHGICAVFCQLSCGGSVWCSAPFEPGNFLKAFQQFRPTWFSASPAMQSVIVRLAQEFPESFRSTPLRFVRSAGSAPAAHVLLLEEEALGVPVLDGYGLTEAPSVARNTLSQRKHGSAGRSSGTQIAIMDDSGSLLPPETVGEIVLRGDTVISEYVDNPDANLAAFHNGWFRTGDLGQLDREGFLFVVGRRKEMINRGGKKVFPQEVDDVLNRHPAVAEVAAFGIPHRTLGEDVAAAVVLRSGAVSTELELRRFVAQRLAGYKVPRRIVFVHQVPRNAAGKPKRNVLAADFPNGIPSPQPVPASSHLSSLEQQIVEIWRRLLAIDYVDIHDDFFDLGGDSLTTALMLSEIERVVESQGGRLDLTDFFVARTVASLAGAIIEATHAPPQDSGGARILFLRKQGSRAPFFCFSHSEQSPHQFQHLVRWLAPEQPFIVVCSPPAMQEGRLNTIEEIARRSAASIRAVYPTGPYLLGGYCFGGLVAFETARQLIHDGSEVGLVALFDTPAPGYPKVAREWKRYARQSSLVIRTLIHGKRLFTGAQIKSHVRALARIVARKLRAKTTRHLSTAGLANPPDIPSAKVVLRQEYAPGMLSAPIVHFISADVPVSATVLQDPRLGWQDFALGGFQAPIVPGDHVSIFSAANAPALASQLELALAASPACLQPQLQPGAESPDAGQPAVFARTVAAE